MYVSPHLDGKSYLLNMHYNTIWAKYCWCLGHRLGVKTWVGLYLSLPELDLLEFDAIA